MFNGFDLKKIDHQMMKDIDQLPASKCGEKKGVVWMRDDYLSMRGMSWSRSNDDETYILLEKVAILKDEMIEGGYVFNCDRWYEGEF